MQRALILLLLTALPTGCGTPPADDGGPPPPPVETTTGPRWTTAFGEPAVLLADEIVVEGPRGLLDHLALRQDPQVFDYVAETTPQGFRQTSTLRAGASEAGVRAQLDAWQLVAMRRIVVLERPGPGAVLVRARGEVYWHSTGDDRERRAPELTFRGEPGP